MNRMFRPTLVLAILLITSFAAAQNQNPPTRQPGQLPQAGNGQTGTRQQQQGNGHASTSDGLLAACLMVDNQNEVAMGQMAAKRAKSDDVKEFAEMMQKDHQAFLGKLQQFAGGMAIHQSRAQQEEQPRGERQTGNDQAHHRGGIDLLSLKRELGAQCLQSSQKELSEKEGAEFDECYIGLQIAAHMHAIDTMKVFKNHASPNMQSALDDGIKTAQTHLKHAKGLIKELAAKEQASIASRRDKDSDSKK